MESQSFDRVVRREHITALLDTFGDTNALHVDADAASAHGYAREFAHGAILVGLLSEIMGVALGSEPLTVCCGLQIAFEQPFYEGDRLRFDVRVKRHSDAIGVRSYEFAVLRRDQRIARGSFMTKAVHTRAYALAQRTAAG
jgi:3-hydroxybutyryl-CoA dehydratase